MKCLTSIITFLIILGNINLDRDRTIQFLDYSSDFACRDLEVAPTKRDH